MRAVILMWKYTRMIVLVALCAALYTTAILVFITPPPLTLTFIGQLLTIPMSLLFGPAGAWGIALGNVVVNVITGQGLVVMPSAFVGNFLLGFLPFAMWTRLRPIATGSRETSLTSVRQWIEYVIVVVGTALGIAVVISWPLDLLGVTPFSFLIALIGVQDAIVGIIASVLLLLVYGRIKKLRFLYWNIMDEKDLDRPSRPTGTIGAWIVVTAAVLSWGLGGYIFPHEARIIGGIGTVAIIIGAALMW